MLVAIAVGVLAASISLGRLWLGSNLAPTEVLWAEDGLFPLCIRKADALTCAVDPFAGYLLFLPRMVAWPISLMPWEFWATATNIAAALLAGLIATLGVLVLRRAGLGWFVSVATSLLPVSAPVVGLEAINALGSSYMLLLFLATIIIALPPARVPQNRARVWAIAFLLLVTALTIPSTIVLLIALALAVSKRMYSLKLAAVWAGAMVLGLIAQVMVALNAASPRSIDFGWNTINAWAEAIPVSLLTYWPGLSLGEYSLFTNFTLRPFAGTGWLITIGLFVAGLALLVKKNIRLVSAGLLILSGLGLGLIPSAIGYANNRYFVVPLLLWAAAVLVMLDPVIRRTRSWALALASLLVLLVWSPAFPASQFRATPAPEWSLEVARIEAKCESDPSFVDRPLFTPFWPPNWGDGLTEPTHPNLPCTVVWRWIGD